MGKCEVDTVILILIFFAVISIAIYYHGTCNLRYSAIWDLESLRKRPRLPQTHGKTLANKCIEGAVVIYVALQKSLRPALTFLVGHILFAIAVYQAELWIDGHNMLVVFGFFFGFFVAKQHQRIVVR